VAAAASIRDATTFAALRSYSSSALGDVRVRITRPPSVLAARALPALQPHNSQCGRARYRVVAYMIEQGEQDKILRVIERHGRQISRIRGLPPRARRH
jgi:hypothetical protein